MNRFDRFVIVTMALVMAWLAAILVENAFAQQAITIYTVSERPV